MHKVLYIDGALFLGYELLQEYGFSVDTIRNWKKRGATTINQNGRAYIHFDFIPAPSRRKLPPAEELKGMTREGEKDMQVESFYQKLHYAKFEKFISYRDYYRDNYGFSAERLRDTAMRRAAWERLMELHQDNRNGDMGGLKKGVLTALYKAYCKLYPGQYTTEQSFSRAIKSAREVGVNAFVVDKRVLRNSDGPAKKYDERHELFLRGILSSGKAYQSSAILAKLKPMCEDAEILCPSLSWIKSKKTELLKQFDLHNSRYGAEPTDKITPYAGIKSALYADDQYQIDGWDLPFYYLGKDKFGNPRLKKLVLVAVRDAYSRKIVGYSVGTSENRLILFEALQDAASLTGAMPFELVSDNHSYNETKELAYFKEQLTKIGVTWTVDHNPKRKAIAERYFKDLGERFCKEHYGYIGQGIRTKEKDGRTKQELIDQYQRANKLLTEDRIRIIATEVVRSFNSTTLPSKGKSPNQLYKESSKPHSITIDLYERVRLFTLRTEYKVTRGQINMVIGGTKYEYQLNAEMYAKYNSRTVAVRYDTPETIYLFDKKTDEAIGSLNQKEKAHGALANQTERDIEIMNRHSGRIKGIKTQARNENEEIARKAAELDPRVYEILNRRMTPKDVLKMAEEDADLRYAVEERGINLKLVEPMVLESEVDNPAFVSAKRSEREKSPFAVKDNQIRVINLEEE